jgi:uncharacterized protein (TIGR02757 family)
VKVHDLKAFLEEKVEFYNQPEFIITDPISIPHRYSIKEDIEIAGFLSATIAWGNRVSILRNGSKLMEMMDNSPHNFVMNASEKDKARLEKFVHRTFNNSDVLFFIEALRNIYQNQGGLEKSFSEGMNDDDIDVLPAIMHFRALFLSTPHLSRSEKHIANPAGGSTAKRINMFLRWMVRKDDKGVDFGIWDNIKPSQLCCPLDVHSGRVARQLGLLNRTQNDWKAVTELTDNLRKFEPADPVKYDFALFGTGINEK